MSPSSADPNGDRSLGELFGDLSRDLGGLLRAEVQLAKTEARDEAGQAASAGLAVVVSGVAVHLMLIMASFGLVLLLDEVMPTGLAFAVVAAIWAAVAGALAVMARQRVARLQVLPETKKTIQEDVTWTKTLTN